jgi:hypothetical protein
MLDQHFDAVDRGRVVNVMCVVENEMYPNRQGVDRVDELGEKVGLHSVPGRAQFGQALSSYSIDRLQRVKNA